MPSRSRPAASDASTRISSPSLSVGNMESPVTRITDRSRGLPSAMRLSQRSEEHTSELQSLMRISYAVFCLKKNMTYRVYMNDIESYNHRTKHEREPPK